MTKAQFWGFSLHAQHLIKRVSTMIDNTWGRRVLQSVRAWAVITKKKGRRFLRPLKRARKKSVCIPKEAGGFFSREETADKRFPLSRFRHEKQQQE